MDSSRILDPRHHVCRADPALERADTNMLPLLLAVEDCITEFIAQIGGGYEVLYEHWVRMRHGASAVFLAGDRHGVVAKRSTLAAKLETY